MLGFIFKRALYGLLVLFGVVTVVFFIFNIKPGDPARMLSDQRANEQTLDAIRKDLGLDRPLFQRYLLYLNDISPLSYNELKDSESPLYLDADKYSVLTKVPLGSNAMVLKLPYLRRSYQSQRKVTDIIRGAFPATFLLATVAMGAAIIIGLILGIFAALGKGGAFDRSVLVVSVLGMAGPSFFMAVIIAWMGGYVWFEQVSIPLIPFYCFALGFVFFYVKKQFRGRPKEFKMKVPEPKSALSFSFNWFGIGVLYWMFAGAVNWYFKGSILPFVDHYAYLPGTGLNMFGSMTDVDPFYGEHYEMKNLILPAITLGIRPLAIIVQLTRSSLLEVMGQDHIRTARAKGLSEGRIIFGHALKNSLNPVVTAVSGWFASLLAGAVFVEYVFDWKGLGLEVFNSLEKEDLPVVMGAVLVIAAIFVVINILVDIIYAWLDPRVRMH